MSLDECVHGLSPASTCGTCRHGPRSNAELRQRTSVAHCRSCGAEIVWVVTEKGKRMPLDAEPSDDGTFVKTRVEGNDKLVRFVPPAARTGRLYTSHFATCPDANEHRRSTPT